MRQHPLLPGDHRARPRTVAGCRAERCPRGGHSEESLALDSADFSLMTSSTSQEPAWPPLVGGNRHKTSLLSMTGVGPEWAPPFCREKRLRGAKTLSSWTQI